MAVIERGTDTLAPGTEIDAYVIRRVLGAGGFGVTYLGEHRRLGKEFAIKEFFPRAFAYRSGDAVSARTGGEGTYAWGLDRFLQEARALAKFHHNAIVGVSNVFEANGTAYMVLSFEHGQDMRDWLAGLRRPPTQAELDSIVSPLLDALAILHGSGLLHRDIAPDNIFIRRDGTPVLLDFGAARSALSEHSAQMSAIVKTGYSPPEQYTTEGRDQGPWSDIYAFGATLYWAVTGELPPESTARTLSDRYVAAGRKVRGSFRQSFLVAIDDALKVSPDKRPRSIGEWRRALEARSPASDAPVLHPAASPVIEARPAATPVAAPAVAQAFVATQAAPVAAETRPEPPAASAPIDLGPGLERRKRSMTGRIGRALLYTVLALALALAAIIGLALYLDQQRNRQQASIASGGASNGAGTIVAGAVAECDRLASIPFDPLAKAPGVVLGAIDGNAAVKACTAAASAADASSGPRVRAQLGYALTTTGKIRDAAQAFTTAASAGYPEAMALHAELMVDGINPIAYDAKAGCLLAEKAMNAGSHNGRTVLGNCILVGIGGYTRDPARAAALYREAASNGQVVASLSHGIMLRDGTGVARDLAQARKIFEDADRQGDPRGAYLLGHLYAFGLGVNKDASRAAEYYRRARIGLELRAAANEIDSSRLLGLMWLGGEGVTKDPKRGLALLETAAAGGSTFAMSSLGSLYESGAGVKQDYATALRWMRAAAARDSQSALNNLGVMYQEARGVARDYAAALRYYEKSAELGYADAMNNAGEIYYYGRDVPEDFAKAMTWYQRAAELGHGAAMYSIGTMMGSGRGANQSYTEARKWYQRAADVGNANAMTALGNQFKDGRAGKKDLAEALRWYRKAAALDDGDAIDSIGVAYRDGEGVSSDLAQARDWFKRAADLNNAKGAHHLGAMYLLGQGVPVNYGEALVWFKRAVDQNLPAALSDLGYMNLRGLGVPVNEIAAFSLFERAAGLGYGTAMHNLANLYETGRGATKNCAQARNWYTKAIEAGYEQSRNALAELNKSKC